MPLREADTRAKLIDPALHARGWTEDLIRREETAGAVEIVGDRPRRRAKGRVDYTLRVKVNATSQPVAGGRGAPAAGRRRRPRCSRAIPAARRLDATTRMPRSEPCWRGWRAA